MPLLGVSTLLGSTAEPDHELLVIVGAPGEERFEKGFFAAAEAWEEAASQGNARITILGREESEESDRDCIQAWIASLDPQSSAPAWIVYLGHGTHTSRRTALNLRGPDLDAETLASWLEPVQRPLAFIHGGSASAPFINHLSKPNRVLITATRSGEELNYARFGEYFAKAISATEGDSNQDGQVSLLEAFVTASRSVEDFYREAGRLASEHALIDDNGDRTGTPPDWYRGERLVKQPAKGTLPDGLRARQIALIVSEQESRLSPEQRLERDRLEIELELVRAKKDALPESDYYNQLEAIFLELSKIYLAPEDS